MSATLDYALRLAKRGIPSFPCRPDKKPATEHGFHDATTDPTVLRLIWRHRPDTLIGVPCGPASGISVVDIDSARHTEAGEWYEANRSRLQPTRTHKTRSGGLHLLFRHADGVINSEGKRVVGVDTRGQGGFFVWWPAVRGCEIVGSRLAGWPTWISEWLWPRQPQPKPRQAGHRLAEGHARDYAMVLASQVLCDLRRAPSGQRHFKLRRAACTIGGLIDKLGLSKEAAIQFLLDAAEDAGADDLACARRTAESGIEWGLQRPLDTAGGQP